MPDLPTPIPPEAKSVLLIDDHPVVALGLRLAFQELGLFALAGVAGEPKAAAGLIAASAPDAMVVDLVFGGAVQMGLLTACRAARPQARIVAFSSLPARLYEQEALRAGADAFVSKDDDLGALVEVLRGLLLEGAPRVRHAEPPRGSGPGPVLDGIHFTPRESDIARALALGHSVARIAQQTGASANTVAAHRDNIRRKLGCRDTTELVARLARLYGAAPHG